MTSTSTIFSSRQFVHKPSHVTIADGSTTKSTGLGYGPGTSTFTLEYVLHVPHFEFNPMSIS